MSDMAAFDALPKRVREAMHDALFPCDPSTVAYLVQKHGEDWVIANEAKKKRAANAYQAGVGERQLRTNRSYLR